MDALVNNKQTYEVVKRDPTPALQRKLNNKLPTLKKTERIDCRRYNRLKCSVPQPPKLYGLPKLHKPNIPMRPIVSFCGSPTYQLSKYLTNVLKPLTDESRHKLQSTENFIDAIKTVQIPDDHKLVSFDVSLRASSPIWASEASRLRTRERAAKPRGAGRSRVSSRVPLAKWRACSHAIRREIAVHQYSTSTGSRLY